MGEQQRASACGGSRKTAETHHPSTPLGRQLSRANDGSLSRPAHDLVRQAHRHHQLSAYCGETEADPPRHQGRERTQFGYKVALAGAVVTNNRAHAGRQQIALISRMSQKRKPRRLMREIGQHLGITTKRAHYVTWSPTPQAATQLVAN